MAVQQSTKKTEKIEDFANNWKRGCKKLRAYFIHNANPLLSGSFLKFKDLVGAEPADPVEMDHWFSSWNTHSFPNDF
jgi:hypothetical protein